MRHYLDIPLHQIKIYIAGLLLALLCLLPVSTQAAQANILELGMNLNQVAHTNTEYPFVDCMKMASYWRVLLDWSTTTDYEHLFTFDNNGWPTSVPFYYEETDGDYCVETYLPIPEAGTYTVIMEGVGYVSFDFVDYVNQQQFQDLTFFPNGGTNSFELKTPEGAAINPNLMLVMRIWESAASDPVRNIRMIRPGYAATYTTQPFHPNFLNTLAPFQVLRFAQWNEDKEDENASWSNRIPPSAAFQTTDKGVAWEYIVFLANTLSQDIWINIPTRADDGYVQALAQFLRDNLASNLKMYVEYSRETWDWGWRRNYCATQGQALSLGTTDDENLHYYHVYRSAQIWRIFEQELGGTARLVKVLTTQGENTSITNTRLEALSDNTVNPYAMQPDLLAGNHYFGTTYSQTDIDEQGYPSVYEMLIHVATESLEAERVIITSQSQLAQTHNLDYGCYSFGANLTTYIYGDTILDYLLIQANRDPRMYNRYMEFMDTLAYAGVGLACHCLSVNFYSSGRAVHAALEYQTQPTSAAPKYRALLDYMNSTTNLASDGMLPRDVDPIPGKRTSLAYPNPSSDTVYFVYSEENVREVLIDIFNLAGERIAHLHAAGSEFPIVWLPENISPGVYAYCMTLKKDGKTIKLDSRKIALTK